MRQEETRLEDIELSLILPNGPGDGEIILTSKKVFEDRRPEMGDICCCGLPTMLELYYNTGNIWAVSPFIDTDHVFPEFLKQGTIKGEVCGVPALVFKGNAGGSAEGGTVEAAGDPPGWTSDVMLNWAGTPYGREVSAVHSWAVWRAAREYRFARLYTDALNNDAAIAFYHANGYICEPYLNLEDPACLQYKTLIFSKPLADEPLVFWNGRNIHLTEQIEKQRKSFRHIL